MSQFDTYREAIKNVINNPSGITRLSLRLLREIHENKAEIFDPSNPFVQSLEISAANVSALLQGFEVADRRLYPAMARSEDDLYLHMSDKDYIGRFALPCTKEFQLITQLDNLKAQLLEDPSVGYKKIVIPRNSKFTAGGIVFSIPYPIEIRQMNHGGFMVVWDVGAGSPVAQVETNEIPFSIQRIDKDGVGVDYFTMLFPTFQYDIYSAKVDFTASSRLSTSVQFEDQFYMVRAYISRNEGNGQTDVWEEIAVTHTDQVYDPNVITLAVKVVDNIVEAEIPLIYVNNFNLVGKLRLDVYTTQGALTMNMSSLSSGAFGFSWLAIDPNEQTIYTKNLSKLQDTQVWASGVVNGGRNKLDFEELRRRVIYNTVGPRIQPITPDQIQTVLADLNYEIVKNIDLITNRIYLATRTLPPPQDSRLITSASLSVQTAIFNADDIAGFDSVYDNGQSITISSNAVFQNRAGRTYLLPQSEIDPIKALPNDQQALAVTNGNYYYTPFHYVLEMAESEFDARVYYLDAPIASNKIFVAENDSTLLACTTNSYAFYKTTNGYVLDIQTRESDSVKQISDNEIFAQLAFTPIGENSMAYQNGTIIGKTDDGSRVYRFYLDTNYNIDRNDGLELTDFLMFDQAPKILPAALTSTFHILYSTTQFMPSTWKANTVDDYLGKFLLPSNHAGITHEQLTLKFGDALKELWIRSRAIAGTQKYQTYPLDIPAVYEENVYELTPEGSYVWFDETNKPYTKLLHAKGDPVLDADNNPVYRHRKGDTILDEITGDPILVSDRSVYRQVDFTLVDGVYYFSTDNIAQAYRKELASIIVGWIMNDLKPLSKELLEITKVFFYPKTTTGDVEVMYGAGLTTSLPAQQAFTVQLHIDDKVDKDTKLKEQLTVKTIAVLNDHLTRAVVAISDIIVDLKQAYGKDVLDVKVSGLGGSENNFPMISIINLTDRCSLRKRLLARNDGILAVEEDLTMDFVRHQINN